MISLFSGEGDAFIGGNLKGKTSFKKQSDSEAVFGRIFRLQLEGKYQSPDNVP